MSGCRIGFDAERRLLARPFEDYCWKRLVSDIPKEFERLRDLARQAISPIKPADNNTIAVKDFLFTARKAVEASELPPPHLIYFLMVELLGFEDLGRFEKLAWSIPIDFNGRAFLIEHRKFGVGVFVQGDDDRENARAVARLLKKGVRYGTRFFEWKAKEAIRASHFNITNNSRILFQRFEYLAEQFQKLYDEAQSRKDEVVRTQISASSWTVTRPSFKLYKEARWQAMAAIDAFYSWTEHVFVHIAILNGTVTTGPEFTALSGSEWSIKFKTALDFSDPKMKSHFDKMSTLRKQLRNFLAHGAFGKDGKTLYFHSNAGAVPVILDVTTKKNNFILGDVLEFDEDRAFSIIKDFIVYLWFGPREAARVYIQEWELPLILTYAQDGTYQDAMTSLEKMEIFASALGNKIDNAANMDW